MYLGLANRLTWVQSETPALALDLLRGSLDSRVSFSRASSATDIISGVLTSFTTDTPRISAVNGLLIEGSRTNSLRNGNAGGALVGTVGSGGALPTNWYVSAANNLTTEVLASGTRSGFNYVRLRISGTPNNSYYTFLFDSNTQIAAAQNEVWTGSAYLALTSGSMTNISVINAVVREADSGGTALGSTNGAFPALSGSFVRGSSIRTLASASTGRCNAGISFGLTAGQAVDITLEVAAPQLELGAFASSYIPTSSGSATRAADLCTGPVGWVNTAEGTLWVEATTGGIDAAAVTSPRLVCLTNSGVTSYHEIRRLASSSAAQGSTVVTGTAQATMGAAVWNNAVTAKAALGWRNNDEAFCFAGGTVATDTATPNGMPTGLTVLRLGANSPTGGFFFGYLRSLRGWTRRLSDTQIKAVTQ